MNTVFHRYTARSVRRAPHIATVLRGAVGLTLLLPLLTAGLRAVAEEPIGGNRERGDVPGWVMITLMSAVLVAGLLAIAGPALEGLFQSAMDQVNQGR
ncbi:MAG: hypothetical protein ACHP7K_11185 [Actinomycetales bacterium]